MLLQVSYSELGIVHVDPQSRAKALIIHASKYLTKNFLIDLHIPSDFYIGLDDSHCRIFALERNALELFINGVINFCRMNSTSSVRIHTLGLTFLILEISNATQLYP